MASVRPSLAAPGERAYSPGARASHAPDPSRVLVIGCGALARELVAVIDQAGLANVDLTCLPATLHNRPGGIPAAVRAKIRAARPRYERIFIAYADCGTGGLLDLVLADEGVERLPGAHCYEVYAGSDAFAAMSDEDPATFYLTDFLARNFDRLVIRGLGLDRHPELLPAYFGNYHRLVYLAPDRGPGPGRGRAARGAASRADLRAATDRLRRHRDGPRGGGDPCGLHDEAACAGSNNRVDDRGSRTQTSGFVATAAKRPARRAPSRQGFAPGASVAPNEGSFAPLVAPRATRRVDLARAATIRPDVVRGTAPGLRCGATSAGSRTTGPGGLLRWPPCP